MTDVRFIMGGIGLATALIAAGPALAQPAGEEILVEGQYGTAPDSVRTLSQAVSYADLDLSLAADRDELRQRVRLTARFLCDKLGEGGAGGSSLTPSCRDEAARGAMTRVGTIEEGFAPRGTTWVRGPAWKSPYPTDWPRRYP
jgi:UrcA family protein